MAAGRIYTVEFDNVTVSAAQDFFYVAPADDKPVLILGLFLGQSSDVGDAASEILRYRIIRGHSTVGSGGSSVTARAPVDGAGADWAFTARINDTTPASAGTAFNCHSDTFHIATGEKLWFPDDCQPGASQANGSIVVRLLANPTDALTMSGTLYVRELG